MRIYVRNIAGDIIGGGEYDINTDIRALRADLEQHGVSRYTATTGQLIYNGEIVGYEHSDKRIGSYAERMNWQPNNNGVIMLDFMPSVVDMLINAINKHLTDNHQQFINLISMPREGAPPEDALILNLANWGELCHPIYGYLFGLRAQDPRGREQQGDIPGMCVKIVASSLGTTHQELLNRFDEGGMNAIREYSDRVRKICDSFRFTAMIRSQLPDILLQQLRGKMRGAGRRADYYP
jgi:hypothetical protein